MASDLENIFQHLYPLYLVFLLQIFGLVLLIQLKQKAMAIFGKHLENKRQSKFSTPLLKSVELHILQKMEVIRVATIVYAVQPLSQVIS